MRDVVLTGKNHEGLSVAKRFVEWVENQSGASVVGARRRPYDVSMRRAVVIVLRDWGLSTPECGHLLSKDHTSILYHEQQGRGDDSSVATALRLRNAFEVYAKLDTVSAGGESLLKTVLLDHMTYRAAQVVLDLSKAHSGSLLAALQSICLEFAARRVGEEARISGVGR